MTNFHFLLRRQSIRKENARTRRFWQLAATMTWLLLFSDRGHSFELQRQSPFLL
jgi:hypothetical protein